MVQQQRFHKLRLFHRLILLLGIWHTHAFFQPRKIHIRNHIAFHFEAQTHLIRQRAYYTKQIDLSRLFEATSKLYDSNAATLNILERFISSNQPKLNVSENWNPPPHFEMGSYTHLPPEIARRVCEDKGQHLPELMTHEDHRDFTNFMRTQGINQTFAGLYQDSARMTKRFITSGIPFNSGYMSNHIYYEGQGGKTVLLDSNANTLHDDLDKIGTYDQEGHMIFTNLHPAYSTNRIVIGPSTLIYDSNTKYWRYNIFIESLLAKMRIENIIDIDDWNIKLPVICQNSKQAREHAPETTPTEDFNNELLFQAIDATLRKPRPY
jgi:hypothetical protein